MFWRLGSVLDSRPVVAAAWLKVVRSRPSASTSSGEGVEVGRLELGQLAPGLDLGHDLVLGADRLEHAGVGGEARLAAPLLGQPELGEQHLGQLLGEPMVNSSPASIHTSRSSALASCSTRSAMVAHGVHVELHPRALHLHQHVHQWQLDLVQQPGQPVGLQPLALALGQHAGDHRVGRHPVAVAFHLDADAFVAGQLLQRIAPPGGVDQIGGQHGVVLELDVALEALRGSDGLPVVSDQRSIVQGERSRASRPVR